MPAIVTDTLPANTTYITDSLWASAGTYQLTGGVIQWSVELTDSLPATLTFGVTVDSSVTDGTIITDSADFSAAGYLIQQTVSTIIDALPPESTITQPLPDELISGSTYTITGNSFDATSGVDIVEVNISGSGWELASGTTEWQYLWTLPMTDSWFTIEARATDHAGHIEMPGPGVAVHVDNLSPTIASTSPAHGDVELPIDEPLVITFSEPVVPETFAYSCQPDPGSWSVSVSPDGLTFTLQHASFDKGEVYTCTIEQAEDGAGNTLVPGSVPNPWSFTTIADTPVTGVEITGPIEGMIDQTYTFTATTIPISATTPITYVWEVAGQTPVTHTAGLTDTASFAWDTSGSHVITVTVSNSVGTASDTHQITLEASYDTFLPFVTKGGESYTGQAVSSRMVTLQAERQQSFLLL